MTENQRKILIGVGAAVLVMLLFPPYVIRGTNNIIRESGYAFLFDLPHRGQVDVATLLVQWVGVVAAGAIGFYLFKAK